MSKIVALDFGTKRIGVAITDDLNIIASGLDTVLNENILSTSKNSAFLGKKLKGKVYGVFANKKLVLN